MMDIYYEHIKPDDEAALAAACDIERQCFPPSEQEEEAVLRERMVNAPDFFWLVRLSETNEIIGFANGIPSKQEEFTDEVFTDISLCDHNGEWVMIISIEIAPRYQGQGICRQLLDHIIAELKAKGRYKGGLGICKEGLVPYYESFGACDLGPSNCHYGGAAWHDIVFYF